MSATFQLEPCVYTMEQAFGIKHAKQVHGFKTHPAAPLKKKYFFHRGMLGDMLAFMDSGETACGLIGERGTGKTSFVEQFHARLQLPLVSVQASADMLSEKLLGQWVMQSDRSMQYKYAGVLLAAMRGWSVLIDEINLVPPGILSVINRLLEGYSYDCPETGERIIPQPGFRVFGTCNPADGVQYKDREEFDSATEERFFWITCHYPSAAEEIPMVMEVLATEIDDEAVRQQFAQKMVAVANDIRARHMSRSTAADAMRTVMSTRVLLKWAKFTGLYREISKTGASPLHHALERVLTRAPSVPESEKAAIHEIVQLQTGSAYKQAA